MSPIPERGPGRAGAAAVAWRDPPGAAAGAVEGALAPRLRLRQVALASRALEPLAEALGGALGLRIAHRDPEIAVFGLRNALLPVGETFLELLEPAEPETALGRFLDRRGGEGGYMVILQTEGLAAQRRRIEGLGVRVVWEATLPDIATIHLHPRDVGGALLSLDEAEPWESWRWAGPAWREHVRTELARGLTGVELASAEPEALAAHWGAVLGREAAPLGAGRREIALDEGGALRFVPAADGAGEGIAAVEVACAATAQVLERARARGLPTRPDGFAAGGVRVRLR